MERLRRTDWESMRVYEWKNSLITESDLFIELDDNDVSGLETLFPDLRETCVKFDKTYCFVNQEKKTITPLRQASYAFGGMYNSSSPIGDELKGVTVDFKELTWKSYTEFELKTIPGNKLES